MGLFWLVPGESWWNVTGILGGNRNVAILVSYTRKVRSAKVLIASGVIGNTICMTRRSVNIKHSTGTRCTISDSLLWDHRLAAGLVEDIRRVVREGQWETDSESKKCSVAFSPPRRAVSSTGYTFFWKELQLQSPNCLHECELKYLLKVRFSHELSGSKRHTV